MFLDVTSYDKACEGCRCGTAIKMEPELYGE